MRQRNLVLLLDFLLRSIACLEKFVQNVGVVYSRGNLIVLIGPYFGDLNRA